jgi:drug/metabolite transporter (DMT)-like permease
MDLTLTRAHHGRMDTLDRRGKVKAAAALSVAVVMWASAFVAIRAVVASGAYNPGQLSAGRLVVASTLLLLYGLARGRVHLPARRDRVRFLVLGATGQALYQLLLNTGERTVDAGTASLLVSTAPIIASVLAVAFLGERMGLRAWLGTAVAFAGAAAIAAGAGAALRADAGAALVVVATCLWAVFLVVQKTLAARYDGFDLTAWPMWIGTLLLLPFAGGLPGAVAAAPSAANAAVLWLGVFSSVVGFIAWAYAIKRLDVVVATGALYCVPVAAFVIGLVFLGETPQVTALIGGALVLAGVALMRMKGPERFARAEALEEAE